MEPEPGTEAVARFLRKKETERRTAKRFFTTGVALGAVAFLLQLLASRGIVPETGRDAAISAAALLLGIANAARG